MGLETLERRFDAAFGVERSESDRNDILAQRLQQTESALAALGEAYAEPDDLREQVTRLEQQLRDAGLEPWQLPQREEAVTPVFCCASGGRYPLHRSDTTNF